MAVAAGMFNLHAIANSHRVGMFYIAHAKLAFQFAIAQRTIGHAHRDPTSRRFYNNPFQKNDLIFLFVKV